MRAIPGAPPLGPVFAHQFRHHIEYTAIQVDAGGFAQAVEQFRANGGAGLNVTVPFKQEAFRLADQLSERAKIAQAVNTLRFEPDGRLFGDNTAGAGLVHDLEKNLGVQLKDKRILVLGAGGAVRGVLQPLLHRHPALVVIANRTLSKARDLAGEVAHYGKSGASGFKERKGKPFDIVITGPAASLKGEVPPLPDNLF